MMTEMYGNCFLPPNQADIPYTISQINEGIATIIESQNTLVWIEGEISNWKPSTSGHCYFRLKDSQSQIPAVIWRSNVLQLKFDPEDGMAITAIASIRVYQKGGYYQLDVHRMQPAGKGALYAAFEKLKQKLEKEGLFDIEHKRPIPKSIQKLGIVTSKYGAAIQDMIKIAANRAPQTDIVLVNVQVQGEKAAREIVSGIEMLNRHGECQCIIIGRGGGSFEDLQPFNEEIVARAIYNSKIPVISAVGHEIDFTIADFVADLRAPTPSAAIEMALMDTEEERRYFHQLVYSFFGKFNYFIGECENRYKACLRKSTLLKPFRMFMDYNQAKDHSTQMLFKIGREIFKSRQERIAHAATRLNSLSPLSILSRGYSVVTDKNGLTVKSSADVTTGDSISIRLHKGEISALVESVNPNTYTLTEPAVSDQAEME